MIKIKCTKLEQTLLKRSIKANECKGVACDYKEQCDKPEDMTCGQYVVGLIEWEIEDEIIQDYTYKEPCIEEFTKCDMCENLKHCIGKSAVIEITTKWDTSRHFMIGLDGCHKVD